MSVNKSRQHCTAIILYLSCIVASHGGPSPIISSSVKSVNIQAEITEAEASNHSKEIIITVTNNNHIAMWYMSDFGLSDLNIRIYKSNRDPAELTDFGKREIGAYDRDGKKTGFYPFSISYSKVYLPPGEKEEWKINLRKYFLLAPGSYRVEVKIYMHDDTESDEEFAVPLKTFEITAK